MQGISAYLGTLDPLAILAAAASMMALQSLWYSHFLFRKNWVRLSGIRPGDLRPEDKRRGHITSALSAVATAVLLNALVAHAGGSLSMVLFITGFVWLFVMIEQLNHVLWEKQPFALFLLQTTRSLASLELCALVLYVLGSAA